MGRAGNAAALALILSPSPSCGGDSSATLERSAAASGFETLDEHNTLCSKAPGPRGHHGGCHGRRDGGDTALVWQSRDPHRMDTSASCDHKVRESLLQTVSVEVSVDTLLAKTHMIAQRPCVAGKEARMQWSLNGDAAHGHERFLRHQDAPPTRPTKWATCAVRALRQRHDVNDHRRNSNNNSNLLLNLHTCTQ